MERVIGGKFKLGKKIGSGSFGELYLGVLYSRIFVHHFCSLCYVLAHAPVILFLSYFVFVVDLIQVLTYKVERK